MLIKCVIFSSSPFFLLPVSSATACLYVPLWTTTAIPVRYPYIFHYFAKMIKNYLCGDSSFSHNNHRHYLPFTTTNSFIRRDSFNFVCAGKLETTRRNHLLRQEYVWRKTIPHLGHVLVLSWCDAGDNLYPHARHFKIFTHSVPHVGSILRIDVVQSLVHTLWTKSRSAID